MFNSIYLKVLIKQTKIHREFNPGAGEFTGRFKEIRQVTPPSFFPAD